MAALGLLSAIGGAWAARNAPRAPVRPLERTESAAAPQSEAPAAAKYEAKPGIYLVRGEVVALPPGQVTLRHEEVPGLMPPMTMAFSLRLKTAVPRIRVGDRLECRLRVTGSDSWLEALRVTDSGAVSDTPVSPAVYRAPKPGDFIPAVELRNQDGQAVRVAGWGSGPQVVTFIYTRCPLPNYCPLMTQRFERLQAELREAGLLDRARLYSVTLDPEYDTPAVLRAYAGRSSADLRYWQFVTGSPEAVGRLASALGEVYAPDQGLINHNLVTAVIDSRGRLFRAFLGNEWQAADLVSATRKAIERDSK